MDRTKFIKLNLDSRAAIIWQDAEFINTRVYYNAKIVLYQLADYFIEVTLREDAIESIEIQDDQQILYMYVNDIDINLLIE